MIIFRAKVVSIYVMGVLRNFGCLICFCLLAIHVVIPFAFFCNLSYLFL